MGPRTVGPRRVEPRRGGGPKFRAFFSLSRHNFRSFCVSLSVFSWNFGGVFEGRVLEMCTFGVLGLSCGSGNCAKHQQEPCTLKIPHCPNSLKQRSMLSCRGVQLSPHKLVAANREAPAAPHDSPRTPNVHISRTRPSKTPPKFHERTSKREKKERKLWREERNFGPSGGKRVWRRGCPEEEVSGGGESGRAPKSWTNTQQTHTADSHGGHTQQTHTADTHSRHAQQTHTADTHSRHTQQTHTADNTQHNHTADHTQNLNTTTTHIGPIGLSRIGLSRPKKKRTPKTGLSRIGLSRIGQSRASSLVSCSCVSSRSRTSMFPFRLRRVRVRRCFKSCLKNAFRNTHSVVGGRCSGHVSHLEGSWFDGHGDVHFLFVTCSCTIVTIGRILRHPAKAAPTWSELRRRSSMCPFHLGGWSRGWCFVVASGTHSAPRGSAGAVRWPGRCILRVQESTARMCADLFRGPVHRHWTQFSCIGTFIRNKRTLRHHLVQNNSHHFFPTVTQRSTAKDRSVSTTKQ